MNNRDYCRCRVTGGGHCMYPKKHNLSARDLEGKTSAEPDLRLTDETES